MSNNTIVPAAPTFTDFYKSQGISDAMYQGYLPEEQAGIQNSFAGLQADPTALSTQMQGDFAAQGLDYDPAAGGLQSTDYGMGGLGGAALGLGQLGLGVASYLENKKTSDKQRKLMDQQLASNTYNMAKDKKDSASLAKAFGTA